MRCTGCTWQLDLQGNLACQGLEGSISTLLMQSRHIVALSCAESDIAIGTSTLSSIWPAEVVTGTARRRDQSGITAILRQSDNRTGAVVHASCWALRPIPTEQSAEEVSAKAAKLDAAELPAEKCSAHDYHGVRTVALAASVMPSRVQCTESLNP